MPRKDGSPTIDEMIHDVDDEHYDPRADKPWPPEEDCPGCPAHKDGHHKMSCSIHKGQVHLHVNLNSDVEVEIK